MTEVVALPLALIDPGTNVRSPKGRVRNRGQMLAVDYGLRESIRELGVLQPITVCRTGERYVVLYGHRRLEAARGADLATIPAIVEDEPADKPIRQLVENQHRLAVHPIDIARTLRAWLDEHPDRSQADLARMVGRSQWWVSTKLALLELEAVTQQAIAQGRLGQHSANAARKAATVQRHGRPRVFRLDEEHLGSESPRSASVVVDLSGTSKQGQAKATISVERSESPSIELVIEDGTGHGIMLTLARDAARLLGHRLMQAYQATAVAS